MQDTIFSHVNLVIAELWLLDFVKMRLRIDFQRLNTIDLHCYVAKSCSSSPSFNFSLIRLILGINVNQG